MQAVRECSEIMEGLGNIEGLWLLLMVIFRKVLSQQAPLAPDLKCRVPTPMLRSRHLIAQGSGDVSATQNTAATSAPAKPTSPTDIPMPNF